MSPWLWGLTALVAAGCIQQSIRTIVLAPLRALAWLAERAHAWIVGLLDRLRAAAGRRLVETGLHGGRYRLSYIIGGALSTLACAVFLLAEGMAILWSMSALGLGTAHVPPILQRADLILSGSILAAGVYAAWSAHALDEDVPSLLVVRDWLSPGARRALRRLAVASFALVALAVVGLGALRARELVLAEWIEASTRETADPAASTSSGSHDVPTEPDAIVTATRYVVSVAGAAALMAVSAVAAQLGPAQLAPMLSLLGIWTAMVWLTGLRWIIAGLWALIRAVEALVVHLVDAILSIATIPVRAPVALLRTLHGWGIDRADDTGVVRAGKATIAAVTSVSWDLQLPRPGAWVQATEHRALSPVQSDRRAA